MILKTFALLAFEFFKTGLFAIGGGLATVPFLREIASKYTWFTLDMLSDMIAVSESTPGAIGINMATYAGFSAGNAAGGLLYAVLGGIIATLSLAAPSIIIILMISGAYRKFKSNPLVENAFYAIRPAVTGMIAAVAVTLTESALLTDGFTFVVRDLIGRVNVKTVILFAVIASATNIKPLKKLHPIFVIVFAGICGAVFGM